MRQATCKKGTEYSARAERALMFCVLAAVRAIGYLHYLHWIAPGKCSALAARGCYRCASSLSVARSCRSYKAVAIPRSLSLLSSAGSPK
jgi:hypothetical protein